MNTPTFIPKRFGLSARPALACYREHREIPDLFETLIERVKDTTEKLRVRNEQPKNCSLRSKRQQKSWPRRAKRNSAGKMDISMKSSLPWFLGGMAILYFGVVAYAIYRGRD